MTVTDDLCWTKYIECGSPGKQTVGFLQRNFSDCASSVGSATYITMVCPTLKYALTVWDLYNNKKDT